MTLKLLIAEDARDVAEVIALGARMSWPGCEVSVAASGAEALQRFAEQPPDLVVLDVAMPPPDGLEVCRRIREVSTVPILMLTVRDATVDKIRALDFGADDYLTKPFDPLELLARLRALLRRAHGTSAPSGTTFVLGDFSLDSTTQEVRIKDVSVQLTSIEYRLLEELVRHAGTVLSHHYLLEHVWGPEYARDTHYLKVVVQRLRRKLGDAVEHPSYIQTVWGTGYRFVKPH
ncbi:MAG: Two-component transcriptional response regulator, winged helix family [uncultured Chloroflexia bacterium]|uniref:Two-component transcriptional response regulator, winged helix family n=1 Tax=uncultured Chloroflexia bacterium TaxID=1672391 RepID=A0A6J4JU25_9CHLR|nr:MAG: Two-component transcriptional response regulator, winged helix family [uncultured Chloroflexia bacterium]